MTEPNGNGENGLSCGWIILTTSPFLLLFMSFLLAWYSVARLFKWTGWLYDNIRLPPELEPFTIPLAIVCAVLAVAIWVITGGKNRH